MYKTSALVLDFDNTLTLELVDEDDFVEDPKYILTLKPDDDIENENTKFADQFFGGSKRVDSLKDFLRNANEIADLYILSGNTKSIIINAMSKAGFPLMELFPDKKKIYEGYTRNKYEILNELPDNYSGVVVFVDDHPDSFKNVSNKIIQIQVEEPLNDFYMKIILDKLRNGDRSSPIHGATAGTPPPRATAGTPEPQTPPRATAGTPERPKKKVVRPYMFQTPPRASAGTPGSKRIE